MFKLDLRRLIIFVAFFSAVVTLFNAFYSGYAVQRQLLLERKLAMNQVYAVKLAQISEDFISSVFQQLAYSAQLLNKHYQQGEFLNAEAERLLHQTNSFNGVVFVDAQAKVLANAPRSLGAVGLTLDTPEAQQSLAERMPVVSEPFVSVAGNYVVFISYPVYSKDNRYLGYIGGSIYLQQRNSLYELLSRHYYYDNSYVYVVNQQETLIYHPNKERVGTKVTQSQVVPTVLKGATGVQRSTSSAGEEMLAGYAYVPAASWGVVMQSSRKETLAALNTLLMQMFLKSVPLLVLTLFGIWLLAHWVSRPLWRLADGIPHIDKPHTIDRLKRVQTWYFEAENLKQGLLVGMTALQEKMGRLYHDAQTDPLTQLYNRRALTQVLLDWGSQKQAFAALAVDIDHFKKINDGYGHFIGDEILVQLAAVMHQCSRDRDLCFRVGGEEFLVLLPGASLKAARRVAERLRKTVSQTVFAENVHVSISVGVALWPIHCSDIEQVLPLADAALYQAKQSGRNRVVINDSAIVVLEQNTSAPK